MAAGGDRSAVNRKRAFNLIYMLLYPAVLGTMLVSTDWTGIVSDPSRIICDVDIALSLFLMLYFISQYIENTVLDPAKTSSRYNVYRFVADFIEVLAMFLLFGCVSAMAGQPDDASALVDWPVYTLLVVVFALPLLPKVSRDWSQLTRREKSTSVLSGIAIIATAATGFLNLPWVLIGVVSVLLLVYFVLVLVLFETSADKSA